MQRKALGEPPGRGRDVQQPRPGAARAGRYDEAAAALQEALNIAGPAFGAATISSSRSTRSISAPRSWRARRRTRAPPPRCLLRDGLRVRARAPGVVPGRRRTFVEDDWSLGAARSLLGAVRPAQRR